MFGKVDSIKLLKTLIKFSAVALTSPATVAVARSLYPDNPITRLIVSAAALVLVEGCLLLGWQMLDSQGKHATMAQRWLYAGLAWVAYFALFGIALIHEEGLAGLMFRLTLGVVLLYASVEAGLLANVKVQKQAEKDIMKDWKIKRYARMLARRSAIADLDLNANMRRLDREAQQKLYTLRKEQETKQLVESVKSGNGLKGHEGVDLAESTPSLDEANRKRRLSKREALDKTLQILAEDPDTSPTHIAERIGRSRQTVYDYIKELVEGGYVHRNRGGITVCK